MEDEADGVGFPGALHDGVDDALLVGAVVPLRQVGVAVRVVQRTAHLDPVHAAPTLEPADHNKRESCNDKCESCLVHVTTNWLRIIQQVTWKFICFDMT